ncbi:class I SAM-dependent methyltransferase [Nocardia salmonicida]|uniref:class I SAM-dependent methyltransferase n=1 Tax=Nocardia salmonicida TaxID=53431 RepID=UPI0033D75F9F
MDTDGWRENTRTSYNNIADSYADLTRRLLDETPEERAVLASFADLVQAQGGGPVVDVGCGTGRITAHLRQLGVDVFRPGGPLLLGFHVGDESHLLTQGYGGRPMNLYVHRRQHSQMHAWLEDAGFVIDTYRTLSSAESKLGGIILAHRRVADPER